MKVRVIVPKFGSYKEGDELDMSESTAKAVAKNGKVELLEGESEDKPSKKSKKK